MNDISKIFEVTKPEMQFMWFERTEQIYACLEATHYIGYSEHALREVLSEKLNKDPSELIGEELSIYIHPDDTAVLVSGENVSEKFTAEEVAAIREVCERNYGFEFQKLFENEEMQSILSGIRFTDNGYTDYGYDRDKDGKLFLTSQMRSEYPGFKAIDEQAYDYAEQLAALTAKRLHEDPAQFIGTPMEIHIHEDKTKVYVGNKDVTAAFNAGELELIRFHFGTEDKIAELLSADIKPLHLDNLHLDSHTGFTSFLDDEVEIPEDMHLAVRMYLNGTAEIPSELVKREMLYAGTSYADDARNISEFVEMYLKYDNNGLFLSLYNTDWDSDSFIPLFREEKEALAAAYLKAKGEMLEAGYERLVLIENNLNALNEKIEFDDLKPDTYTFHKPYLSDFPHRLDEPAEAAVCCEILAYGQRQNLIDRANIELWKMRRDYPFDYTNAPVFENSEDTKMELCYSKSKGVAVFMYSDVGTVTIPMEYQTDKFMKAFEEKTGKSLEETLENLQKKQKEKTTPELD